MNRKLFLKLMIGLPALVLSKLEVRATEPISPYRVTLTAWYPDRRPTRKITEISYFTRNKPRFAIEMTAWDRLYQACDTGGHSDFWITIHRGDELATTLYCRPKKEGDTCLHERRHLSFTQT